MTVKAPFMPHYGANKVVSGTAKIDSMAKTVRVVNTGSSAVYVRIGTGAITASDADTPVLGGTALLIQKQMGDDTIATTGSVNVQTGEGCFQ